jgi:hypothetical protein
MDFAFAGFYFIIVQHSVVFEVLWITLGALRTWWRSLKHLWVMRAYEH